MDTIAPSTFACGVQSMRRATGLRKVLLTSTALALAMMLPAAGPARAQDATWQTSPGSGDFFDTNNWTPNSVPTGTATFGTSSMPALTLGSSGTFDGWTLNAGASNYTFTILASTSQDFTGTGITINGGSAGIVNYGSLSFTNTSTAGSATITNGSVLNFHDSSSAGSATITNTATMAFTTASTAGSASISNSGNLTFHHNSTAGSATITNGGLLDFRDTSTAGSASIANSSNLRFFGASTAGSATITNTGDVAFFAASSAGNATIVNSNNLFFDGTSTAGSATISNTGTVYFRDAGTADNATITNSGTVQFLGVSSGGNAALINQAGGTIDISGVDTSTTAGSIAGAGDFILGSNRLIVGSNDLSTEVSGVISGIGGRLDKTGAGTLTLTGANTYTGGTTITSASSSSRSTLQLGTAGQAGSILGAVTVGNWSTLAVVNADTSGTTIANNSGYVSFYNTSTAGSATITNNTFGSLSFNNASTAGSASITNDGGLFFNNTSTAGSATITNNQYLQFYQNSTAGNATITNNSVWELFENTSADSATIINTSSGTLYFYDSASAGSAAIAQNGVLQFLGTSTAGNATINNTNTLEFFSTSTAGNAAITNSAFMNFYGSSTAGSASITNNGVLYFSDSSSAGNATITNDSNLIFLGNSTAGNASLINNAGGIVDFSGSTGPGNDGRLSAGSIAGAGNFILGTNQLSVGSNNLSTEVSGVISGAGSLVKTGTGTLILSGANTYTGGTTIAGGTLQFGNGVSGGVTNLSGSINVTGGTLAIQAPTMLNVAQAVTFGNNTALSIAAGAGSPSLTADSITIGNGVAFNISGITNASQLDMVLINTASGISGDFADIHVGGFSGTVDYLTVSTHKSADGLQYLASYGLAWSAGNNLATGTFTLTNATDSFTVGAVLADQTANAATGWNGTALTKAGDGTLTLTGTNTYTGGTTISGGTLSVSRDANLGAATGGLTFTGGTLAITASFDTARTMSLTQAGRFDVATGTELGLTGMVSGSGDLIKQGGGTLRLDNGANAYGNTLVAAGTLVGNAASISGNIGNAGTLVFNETGNAGFSGDIVALNGTRGAMIKRGAGVLTLTGLSLLDWGIEAGGLVASAERFGGNAAIAAGASFTLDQSANATYAGVLSGNGGFSKTGSGLLNLTGDSSGFAGTTRVAAGTLAVNGSLGGMLDVLAAGRLQGTATIGNTAVSGTIAPGNSIGTINVAGNITFNAGSNYEVEVDAAGQSDRIVATGAATINGGTVTVLAGAGSYAPQTQYTIVTASGGRTGAFTGVTSDLAFLDPSLSYDANNVYLTMTRNNIDFAAIGLTANQKATGTGVQSLGWGSTLYGAVVNLSAQQAQQAFERLSGEAHASFKTALIEDSRFIREAGLERLRAAMSDIGGDKGRQSEKRISDHLTLWGQAFGAFGQRKGDGNAASLSRNTGGLLFGGDVEVKDNARLGLMGGYSRSSLGVSGRSSSGTADTYTLGSYGGVRWKSFSLKAGLAHSWHDLNASRSVIFTGFADNLSARYGARTLQAYGEAAFGFGIGALRFEPFANLAYVNHSTDGFTEKGGPAALGSRSATTNTTFTTLGLRAETSLRVGATDITLHGMAGWRHAFGATPSSVFTFAAGGTAFTVAGVSTSRDVLVLDAGFDVNLTKNATLGFSYSGQLGSGLRNHAGKAGFNVKF